MRTPRTAAAAMGSPPPRDPPVRAALLHPPSSVSVCLCLSLSACPSVRFSVCLCLSLSARPSVRFSVSPPVWLLACSAAGLSGCCFLGLWLYVLPVPLFSPWLFLCVCLSVRLSDRLYVCIFLSVFVPPQLIPRPELMWLCIHCFHFLD